jgi:DNA polymerase-3 subunit delta'
VNYWHEIVGQPEAVRALSAAAEPGAGDELANAWLITGPAGSGRSNIAELFAAALIARTSDERATVLAQVLAKTHPDFTSLATQKVIISIEEVRELATTAHYAPSMGRHRVILIEDADRMPERTSNVLLKSLEEPPERTIWILCAPSEADLIPTIRSRVRSLRLVTPHVDEVAALLAERDGVALDVAERSARLAQSHIGMARRLATDEAALTRRQRSIDLVLASETIADVMRAATELAKIAADDADALSAELDAQEREDTLRNLGIVPGAAIPAGLRGQIKALEDDQKRRATRNLRDGIDRILTDLLSLFRDVLLVQLDTQPELVNREHDAGIRARARDTTPQMTLGVIDAIETARERIARNVTPGLALEAMLVSTLK